MLYAARDLENLKKLSENDDPLIAVAAKKFYCKACYARIENNDITTEINSAFNDALERIAKEEDESVVVYEIEELLKTLKRYSALQDDKKSKLVEVLKNSDRVEIRRLQYLPEL